MFMDINVRQSRYAPGLLVPPKSELVFWTPVLKDSRGNQTAEITCPRTAEVRFVKPAASPNFHVTIRGELTDGVGDEWTIVVPTDRMGLLSVPAGFAAEQSIMGAVYRLLQPRDIRVLADQLAGMPGLNFTLQLL